MIQEIIAAIKAGDAARVRDLIAADPALASAQTENGVSLILLATYYGRRDIAQNLRAHIPALDLFEASAVGDRARVKEIVATQPQSVNTFAPDGFFPLGLAAFFGHTHVAEFLLANGADPNLAAQNSQRVAALHAATASRHLAIVQMLIARGAEVNARQAGGFVPLHAAAQNGQIEMIELLIANGADANARADDGKTPLAFALEEDHLDAATILRKQIAK
ncbi:MAG: ankyrin repeat domain-containing protein [Chloroflexi bacterium]|nr:ankyrin repeat domain-containing protein [Chloroflexota bacterium]